MKISRVLGFWRNAGTHLAIQYGIIAAGWAVAVTQFVFNRGIWNDEASLASSILNKSFGSLLGPLDYLQSAPLLFLWIEKIFSSVIPAEYGLRAFPLLCHIAALPLFLSLCRRLLKSPAAQTVSLALFAFNAMFVYYSSEAKQYGCEVFAAILIYCAATRYNAGGGKRDLAILAACGAIMILISHSAVMHLTAVGIWLSWRKIAMKPGSAKNAAKSLAPLTAVGFLWVFVFTANYWHITNVTPDLRETHVRTFDNIIDVSQFTLARKLGVANISDVYCPTEPGSAAVFVYVKTKSLSSLFLQNMVSFYPVARNPHRSMAIILTIAGLLCAIKNKSPVFVFATVPMAFQLLASASGMYSFMDRLLLHQWPALILLSGLALQAFAGKLPCVWQNILSCIAAIVLAVSAFMAVPVYFCLGDIKRLYEEIVREADGTETVFLSNSHYVRVLGYYRNNPWIENVEKRVIGSRTWLDYDAGLKECQMEKYFSLFKDTEGARDVIGREIQSLEGKVWLVVIRGADLKKYTAAAEAAGGVPMKILKCPSGKCQAHLYDFGSSPSTGR